jgi:hypothetical protein
MEISKASTKVLQGLAIALELTQTSLSEAAIRILAIELSRYPEGQVLGALGRCRKELRGRLTLADIISRLDDGRPGPEEAWAMIPRDEATTVVWTEEMARASGVARPLMADGDMVAARMAFLECYRKIVQEARDSGTEVKWEPSLGTDAAGREAALLDAVNRNRLSADHVRALLPNRTDPSPAVAGLLADTSKRLKATK